MLQHASSVGVSSHKSHKLCAILLVTCSLTRCAINFEQKILALKTFCFMSMRSVKQHWQHIAIILIEFNSYLHIEFVSRMTELTKTEITSYATSLLNAATWVLII